MPDKQVGDQYEPDNLVNQFNRILAYDINMQIKAPIYVF